MKPDDLLPGEDPGSQFLDDAEHWERVYAELVGACRREGLRHDRFEARLAYWRRIRFGTPTSSAAGLTEAEVAEPDLA